MSETNQQVDEEFDPEVIEFLEKHCDALQAGEPVSIPQEYLNKYPELEQLVHCVELLESFAVGPAATKSPESAHKQSLSSSMMQQLPRIFGAFCLEEEIGRGGMGVVYKARHLTLNTYFALKTIRACEFASDEEVRRFFQEARAASRMRHPNIVSVHDAGEQDGIPFLVMTYIDGCTLTECLEPGKVDFDQLTEIMIQVGNAVDYLHGQGIVHRDLKPSNIMIDEDGVTHVADFGLAKVFGGDGERTVSGTILGTPAYMAPEQAWGKVDDVCPQSDIYSLGAVLYELLTGRTPFQEEIALDQLLRLRDSEPKPVRKLNPKVPVALEKICMRCLERKPKYRYESAKELAEDFHRFAEGESLAVQSLGVWAIVRRWCRREPALAVHLIALLFITVIVQARASLSPEPSPSHLIIMQTLGVWLGLSILYQKLINREWHYVRRTWIATDAALFTVAVANARGPFESLIVGYALLIVASSMWYKPRLVAVTTAATVISYCILLTFRGSEETPAHYPYLVTGVLVVTGGIVISLVRRIRQLLTMRSRA